VLLRSGGAFHLLLPDTDATRAALADEQIQLDGWLLDRTQGEVALVLAGRRVTLARLAADGAGAVLTAVGTDLARAKAARFAAALRPAGAWSEGAFLRAPLGGGADECRSCHKQAGEQRTADGTLICGICAEQTEAGAALPRTRVIALHADSATVGGARITLTPTSRRTEHSSPSPPIRPPLRASRPQVPTSPWPTALLSRSSR
jgi:hypothetical protein